MCACIAGATTLHAAAASAAPLAPTTLPAPLGSEAEPNDAPVQASPIMGDQRIRASLSVGDVDYYRFEAHAGDRVFANLVSAGSVSTPIDSRLVLLGSDGLTPIELDDNEGSQFASASSIAGATIAADGVYYLRVEDVRGAAANAAPYDIYLALRSGIPAEEVEKNDEFTEANPLVNGEVKGAHLEPGVDEKDWFAVNLQAGDTVFLSLDLDPERDGVSFNGRLGFARAGDPLKPLILTVDNPELPDATPPSEALTMTVSESGTYYAYVDSAELTASGAEATYDLAVTVFPGTQPSCRTYAPTLTSAFVDGGPTTFPIPVDDAMQIARTAVHLKLQESVMADLDVSLRSPTGLEIPLFTDIGSSAADDPAKRQTLLDVVFDDFAAVPSLYPAVRPLDLRPKSPLAGFSGQQAQGTWLLTIVDDTANASAGNLTAAELVLCGDSPPARNGSPTNGQSQARPAQAPQLSDFTIAPNEFRAAKAGPMVLAKRSKSGGGLVTYQSSEAVQTSLVLFELEEGRKAGKKCARATALNAAKKPCVRPVKVISFVRNGAAGRNQFAFTGRVGARKLPPGEYKLQARGYATSGLTSAPVGATFTVLPPAPVK